MAGPTVTGPKSATCAVGQSVSLPCQVSDPSWPTAAKITAQVSVPIGTVRMTLGGKPVAGSGSASIVLTDTVANVQAALASLAYTA